MRKAFTLIELLIVIIIIGVLAAIAVPQYMTAVERGKVAKAKSNMGLILQGEKMYRANNDIYVITNAQSANTTLGGYVELTQVDSDPDWHYTVTGVSASAMLVTANRQAGQYSTSTISYDQDGVCTNSGGTFNTTLTPCK